jgi:transcriptional regulator of acetoin/glycerol metabolism
MSKVTLRKAREIVLSERDIPDDIATSIRPEVLSSWRRSLLSGAEVSRPELPFVGELDTDSTLCAAADPVLSKLADRLSGLGAGVLLADRHARILRRWVSDANILPMLDTLRSDAGFTGSEEIVGTNGIGTVAETGRPVQIVGHEHLMESMTPFACVGVPVFHPITHRPEGIITMSCRAEAGSALLTPLMMSAAADVEHRMLEQASRRERIVLDAYLEASRGGTRRVAGVGQDIFIAGPRVTALLGGTHQVVLWETVREALGGRASAQSELRLDDGQVVPIRCEPIASQGEIVGALVDFGTPRGTDQGSSAPSPGARVARTAVGMRGMAGSTAAWHDAVATVRAAAVAGGPILVTGEMGVGKSTLLLGALGELDSESAHVVVEVASPAWMDVTTALAAFDEVVREEPAVVLLRHLEAMPPAVAMAMAARLTSYHGSSRIVGTLTSASGAAATPELERLTAAMGGAAVHVPPLRERSEDIPHIAHALLAEETGRRLTLSPGALRAMVRAPWPGNVMQLRSVLRSIAPHAGGEIQAAQLPPEIQACATRRQLTTLEHVELRAILDALKQARGNKVLAARIVGVSRSTLYRKLNSYRIDPEADYF